MPTRSVFVQALIWPLALISGVAQAGTVEGLWLTDDHKALVQIAPCGDALCGRIAQVLDTAPSVPKTDIHNPDPKLRGRTISGLLTLTGFHASGRNWAGRAYDPKTGKSYRSTLVLNPDGSLKVSGCILFLCESRRWTRAR